MKQWLKLLGLCGFGAIALMVLSYFLASENGAEGQFLSMLPASLSIVTVGLAAVFVVSRMASANTGKPYRNLFNKVAVRLEGSVQENMMGEFQLHLPHPLGGMIVELKAETEGVLPGNPINQWTRFCFITNAHSLPSLALKADRGVPVSHPKLNADAVRALTLVRDIDLNALRVTVRRQAQPPRSGASVEILLSSWPHNADELTDQIHMVAPQLVAVADALRRN